MRSASLAACFICLSSILGIAGTTRATAQPGMEQAMAAADFSRYLAAFALAKYAIADCDYDLWVATREQRQSAYNSLSVSAAGRKMREGLSSMSDRYWSYPFPCQRQTPAGLPPQNTPTVQQQQAPAETKKQKAETKKQKGGTAKGPKGELAMPGLNTPGLAFNFGLDALRWCTYGGGSGFPTIAIPTDDNGTPLFPGGPFINAPPTWPVPLTMSPPWGGGDITITDLPSGPTIIETPSGPRIVSPPPGSKPPGSTPPPETPASGPPATPPSTPPSGKPPETPTAGPPSQPPTGKPPETPTAGPPSTPPVSTPPETPIIIFVKATQSVLEGQPQGIGLPGYNTALFPPIKPDLPFTGGSTQTAQQDLGFDKDPVKCTTGQGGECKLELDVGTQQELGIQPTGGAAPNINNFRLDVSVPQTTGGVIEITGLGGNDVINLNTIGSGLPDRVNIVPDIFNIGDRSFLRIGLDQPFGLNFDPGNHFNKLFSDPKLFSKPVTYITDFCRDKQPGPPLGAVPASFVSLNQALPEATINLELSILDRLRALR